MARKAYSEQEREQVRNALLTTVTQCIVDRGLIHSLSLIHIYTSVEKGGDEVWIGEKFQSNPEIAGSPRNSFRASLARVCWRSVSYTHLDVYKRQIWMSAAELERH